MNSSANVTATGTLVAVPAKVFGVHVRSAATAGSVVLKDGGSGGTTKVTLNTPAAAGQVYASFEGGIRFDTDVHATLTNADSVTAIYR